eukprot:533097-Prymnesium_polylepis.2
MAVIDANPLCVSRDGRLLMAPVSPNYDEHNDEWHGPSIGVWDLATGARVMHLKGHSRYQVHDPKYGRPQPKCGRPPTQIWQTPTPTQMWQTPAQIWQTPAPT